MHADYDRMTPPAFNLQAALHRSAGQLSTAIDVLRLYLDHYMNDREAWEELADCYIEVCGSGCSWNFSCIIDFLIPFVSMVVVLLTAVITTRCGKSWQIANTVLLGLYACKSVLLS